MKNPIKIIKATLFECDVEKNIEGKDINVANLVGNKVFKLDSISSNLEDFKNTIEFNIQKKIDALECKNLAKKETKISPLTNMIPLPKSKGRKLKSVIFDIVDNTNLEKILNSSNDKEFKEETRNLANSYVNLAKNPVGILGFIKFQLKINGRFEDFISILITNFQGTALSSDSSNAVIFLEKVFDQNFKNIIFYPYLISANNLGINISKLKVKTYSKVSNPNLLKTFSIKIEDHPDKKLKKLYDKYFGRPSTFANLLKDMGEEVNDSSIDLYLEGNKIKIPLKDFVENFRVISSGEFGEGIFIKKGSVKVMIGNKEIRSDWMLRNRILLDEKHLK